MTHPAGSGRGVPIPPAIWERLLAFLADEKTGQITFYVNQGRIRDATFEERVRATVVDSPP